MNKFGENEKKRIIKIFLRKKIENFLFNFKYFKEWLAGDGWCMFSHSTGI